jgi:hypothetical protein
MPQVLPSHIVRFIKHYYPYLDTDSALGYGHDYFTKEDLPKLASITELLNKLPEHLIALEGINFANFIAAKTEVETMASVLHHQDRAGDADFTRTSIFDKDAKPWDCLKILIKLLTKCPDQTPLHTVNEMMFIDDPDLRANIRIDIGNSEQAFIHNNWKAATVLAGAVVETLLLWKLRQFKNDEISKAVQNALDKKELDKQPPTDMDMWGLPQLIIVSKMLNLVDKDAAVQAGLAQNFRNLIHPGKALREKRTCDRSTASSAISAIQHVIRCFSSKT